MDGTNRFTMYEVCILQARAGRALKGIVSKQLKNFDLTSMEWLLLGAVCSAPPEGYSMSKLAGLLDINKPQATALVSKLIVHKLVRQKTQPKDRRSRHVVATPLGKLVLSDIEGHINKAMRLWLADIPRTDLQTYMNVVYQLSRR